MSAYKQTFLEAIQQWGLKKVLAELFLAGAVIDAVSAGQVIVHYNSGGVTKIVKTAEVK